MAKRTLPPDVRAETIRKATAVQSEPSAQSQPCSSRSRTRTNSELVRSEPLVLPPFPREARVLETNDEYRIILPIGSMDLRNIYVLAQPRSILIEIRTHESRVHELPDPIYSEENTQRAARELYLREPIRRGATTIRIHGDSLQITSQKAKTAEEQSWSELINFERRGSLGCV